MSCLSGTVSLPHSSSYSCARSSSERVVHAPMFCVVQTDWIATSASLSGLWQLLHVQVSSQGSLFLRQIHCLVRQPIHNCRVLVSPFSTHFNPAQSAVLQHTVDSDAIYLKDVLRLSGGQQVLHNSRVYYAPRWLSKCYRISYLVIEKIILWG